MKIDRRTYEAALRSMGIDPAVTRAAHLHSNTIVLEVFVTDEEGHLIIGPDGNSSLTEPRLIHIIG